MSTRTSFADSKTVRETMLVVETRWFFGKRCVFSWNHDIVTFQELEPITSDWTA